MEEPMRPKRRNSRRDTRDPAALAARLPADLRSFGSFGDPDDFKAHLAAVAGFVGSEDLAMPVMNHAGLSAADWYRQALTSRATRS
jgi:hypothetical protein